LYLAEDGGEIERVGIIPIGFLHLVIMDHEVAHRTDTEQMERFVLDEQGSVRRDGVGAKRVHLSDLPICGVDLPTGCRQENI
jgi:hypothetical protein